MHVKSFIFAQSVYIMSRLFYNDLRTQECVAKKLTKFKRIILTGYPFVLLKTQYAKQDVYVGLAQSLLVKF